VRASTVWTLHVAATTADSCQRVIGRVAETIGIEIELESLERYWEDPSHHVAVFTTELDSVDPAAAVLQTLALAGLLRTDWTLTTPQIEADGSWSLDLVAAADAFGGGFLVPGITWAHLQSGTRIRG